jgi:glycine/D-amino acid oxidase-like deaminating enzyme
MEIEIPRQKVPVLAESDVLVCGAGCAGIAAAVAAARHGCSVTLLERWPTVGGMATNALVNGWHRSDRETMVIYGLVEESAQRAAKHGWIRRDRQFPRAHETHWFEPEGMRIVWQRMLEEAGVKTLCHLAAGDPVLENGRIRGVLADTKRGRRALLAKIVIDATGDGDVAAKAGVPFEFGRESDRLVQGMTLIFALRGIDEAAVRATPHARVNEVIDRMVELRKQGRMPPFNEGNMRGTFTYWGASNHIPWNVCPVAGNPLDEEELSRLNAVAHEYVVQYLDFFRANMPGMAGAEIEQTGFALGVRESRRILGLTLLTREMVLGAAKQPDAVGHGVWMVDIHDPKGSGHTTFSDPGEHNKLRAGTSYHIPLRMCLNRQLPNLAVVGRCASSTHEAHSSIRVQTHCMVMGQGVGTAAAMALDSDKKMAQVDVAALQRKLRADGVYLEDVPDAPSAADGGDVQ